MPDADHEAMRDLIRLRGVVRQNRNASASTSSDMRVPARHRTDEHAG